MKKTILFLCSIIFLNCNSSAQKNNNEKKANYSVSKTESEWRSLLTEKEYHVMREGGTESRFSSPLNGNYKKGLYVCKGCETPLFRSEHKFNSGTGWPSFDREIEGNVAYADGNLNNYYGVEEHCAVCGSHLGHIFGDGPTETTGKRHCINGVALKFIPEE